MSVFLTYTILCEALVLNAYCRIWLLDDGRHRQVIGWQRQLMHIGYWRLNEEDLEKGQKTIKTAPLYIDNDMFGHDTLDIPSPTYKYS